MAWLPAAKSRKAPINLLYFTNARGLWVLLHPPLLLNRHEAAQVYWVPCQKQMKWCIEFLSPDISPNITLRPNLLAVDFPKRRRRKKSGGGRPGQQRVHQVRRDWNQTQLHNCLHEGRQKLILWRNKISQKKIFQTTRTRAGCLRVVPSLLSLSSLFSPRGADNQREICYVNYIFSGAFVSFWPR